MARSSGLPFFIMGRQHLSSCIASWMTPQLKADFLFGLRGRLKELLYGIKNYSELIVVLLLHRLDLLLQVLVGQKHLPEPRESPHDLDVDLNSPFTVEHAGEHGDTVFCKCIGQIL